MVCANLNALINRIYPGIGNSRAQDDQYFLDHIILYPRNDEVLTKFILENSLSFVITPLIS